MRAEPHENSYGVLMTPALVLPNAPDRAPESHYPAHFDYWGGRQLEEHPDDGFVSISLGGIPSIVMPRWFAQTCMPSDPAYCGSPEEFMEFNLPGKMPSRFSVHFLLWCVSEDMEEPWGGPGIADPTGQGGHMVGGKEVVVQFQHCAIPSEGTEWRMYQAYSQADYDAEFAMDPLSEPRLMKKVTMLHKWRTGQQRLTGYEVEQMLFTAIRSSL